MDAERERNIRFWLTGPDALDECDSQVARDLLAELDALRAENEKLQASCAAKRKALEQAAAYVMRYPIGTDDDPLEQPGGVRDKVDAVISEALAPDSSAALLERMRRLEAVAEAAGELYDAQIAVDSWMSDRPTAHALYRALAALGSLEGKK